MKKRRKTIDIKIFSAYNQEKIKRWGARKAKREMRNSKRKTVKRFSG